MILLGNQGHGFFKSKERIRLQETDLLRLYQFQLVHSSKDQTFVTFTQKGGGGVLKFVTCLWILLFLNNRSIVHFCGWWKDKKIGNFLWTS